MPKIQVSSDYDGYFEGLVRKLVTEKAESGAAFKHATIVVTAGPYRSSAVSYQSKGDVIHLDFYSALRAGFGSLTDADREGLKGVL